MSPHCTPQSQQGEHTTPAPGPAHSTPQICAGPRPAGPWEKTPSSYAETAWGVVKMRQWQPLLTWDAPWETP